MSGAQKPKRQLNPDGSLTCRVCKVPKPITEYHRNSKVFLGVEGLCKDCSREKARLWRTNHKQSRAKGENYAEKMQAKRMQRKYLQQYSETNLIPGWRDALIQFYGARCLCCGSSVRLEADHVVPLSSGGAHRAENLQVLCRSCNRSKHTKTIDYRNGYIMTEGEMLSIVNRATRPTD